MEFNIDILEYIHNCGFVHQDVKASNLLLGRKRETENQVYLLDLGCCERYEFHGEHVEELPRFIPVGTSIFLSRDSHKGCISRRSDLETLAYNLVRCLNGRLPWEDCQEDCDKMQKEKEKYMKDVCGFFRTLFPGENGPRGILELLLYISYLSFKEEPNYDFCRKLLKDMLTSSDYTLEFKRARKESVKLERLQHERRRLQHEGSLIKHQRKILKRIFNWEKPCYTGILVGVLIIVIIIILVELFLYLVCLGICYVVNNMEKLLLSDQIEYKN